MAIRHMWRVANWLDNADVVFDLDKFNLFKLDYNGLVLGLSQFFLTVPAASKYYSRL